MTTSPDKSISSPNFAFLAKHDALLVRYGAQAERYVFEDANTAIIKLGQFAELLAQRAAACAGVFFTESDKVVDVLSNLWDRGVLTREASQLFHGLRKARNNAVHNHTGTQREALYQLRMARTLAVWFHKAFGHDPSFKAGPFVPPPDPSQAENALLEELDGLRQRLVEYETETSKARDAANMADELRADAEAQAKKAYEDVDAALQLAQETEAQAAAEIELYAERLAQLQVQTAATSAEKVEAVVQYAFKAGEELDLDEADTRKIIDAQLCDVGWEADTQRLNYQQGARPQKGKNLAIAEWPTKTGPADYVFFTGLIPVAVVEAKRKRKDVPGSIEQAKRYSRGYKSSSDEYLPHGPWGKYKVPFMFATNGRPYLKQIATKSGVWFLDGRRPTNHAYALDGWYTPEGLTQLLKQDIDAATEQLREQPSDYLPLRYYQREAINAVEGAVADGKDRMLVAMATGTGKTRTAICMIYRFIKAKRFRRVLFLVDRTALGEQAANVFKDVKLENLQSFTEIYDVKELGDIVPEEDTRLQIATVQGMVKRILYPSPNSEPLPVDAYDCIIVDECHRGYNLDQELTDSELTFRSEADYISKYMRVLEHFDAVKIGLTATPALHTTDLFCGEGRKATYQYSYRQAVIDGYLVDHEPPFRLITALAEDNMHWKQGDVMKIYHTKSEQLELLNVRDDVEMDIETFNKKVITERFNEVICGALAEHIDPSLPGKTLIFCATDSHADMVVELLKKAFEKHYGSVDDDAVLKITGNADKPNFQIRRFKNEPMPKVAVTVDLLTTGIDVPEITNLVFIRRVRSRILYEQMLGRATRLCPDLLGPGMDKEPFFVFDAVDLYSVLESHTNMKPVVTRPSITFTQLVKELANVTEEEIRKDIKEQIVAKLQRKKRSFKGTRTEELETLTGKSPDALIKQLRAFTPQQVSEWFDANSTVADFLDQVVRDGSKLIISDEPDELRRIERGYGDADKPDDYLESFRKYIQENMDAVEALQIVCQRPRDLTRQQLKELKLHLDQSHFSETNLRTAVRETTNQDIAATIIGYIRHVALNDPLIAYEDRVKRAMTKILASRSWTQPQRRWLERIGKQLEKEVIVDKEALDRGQFKDHGGFPRLNKVFDGKLAEILKEISDAVWQVAA